MKSYYIKERHNPQFDEPYYVAEGQLTKTEARRKGRSMYGYNVMLEFKTKKEYEEAIKKYNAKCY